jgi:hypothetical protein
MTPPLVRLKSGAPVQVGMRDSALALALGGLPAHECTNQHCIIIRTMFGPFYWPFIHDTEQPL